MSDFRVESKENDLQFLKDNYPTKGAEFCAKALNTTKWAIHTRCYRNGIKSSRNWRRETNIKKTGTQPLDQYAVHPTQFMEINTPVCAYILGLIWADGSFKNSTCLRLTSTFPDADTFIPLFMQTGKWKYYRTPPGKLGTKDACEMVTSNRILCDFLYENDYRTKSNASADKILSLIPEHLKHYWFRGLLDGDGWCYSGSIEVGIASSFNQDWTYMENICKKLGITYKISRIDSFEKYGGRGSKFLIFGKMKSMIFLNYIYQNYPEDNIALRRKYNKYLEIKERSERINYTGVIKVKGGKWWARSSSTGGVKSKYIGSSDTREGALEIVKKYYETHPKNYLTEYQINSGIGVSSTQFPARLQSCT